MYGGRVAEEGSLNELFYSPRHPYTAGLLASIPTAAARGRRLDAIAGAVPSPLAMPPGCPFAPRCPKAMAACEAMPALTEARPGHRVACHFVEEIASGAIQPHEVAPALVAEGFSGAVALPQVPPEAYTTP